MEINSFRFTNIFASKHDLQSQRFFNDSLSAFPPTADLITTAAQLTNQRMVCVLEACALDGDKVELILNRAFPLRSWLYTNIKLKSS